MKARLGGLLLAAAVTLSAPAYAATTVIFDGNATKHTSASGDYYTQTMTIGGQSVTMTATGWTDYTSPNPDQTLRADLELYTGSAYGFGVSASGDTSSNNTHAVDNAGSTKDFIVLTFSTAVDLSKANFNVFDDTYPYNGVSQDGDATVYYKNGAAAPTDGGNASNYFSQFTSIAVDGSTSGSRDVAGAGIYSDTWVVAANISQSDDAFKLYSVTLDTKPGVPEPATWGLMIVGVGLAGAQLRRRQATARAFA